MVRWEASDLQEKDSAGVTDESSGSFSGGLQQGYELGSLTDGLIAYYPFDGDVNDKALNNDGTDNTSAGFVEGKIGEAKDFDGSDDTLSGIGNLDTFSFVQNTARFCITGWVNGDGDFVGNEINQGDKGFLTTIQSDGDVRHVMYDGSGTKTIDLTTSTQPVSTTDWDHIAVTGNGSQIKIFVNGTQQASGSVSRFSSGPSSKQLEIGYVESYSAFEGQIDDIRIYERPLSQPEIRALYQRASTQKISDQDRLTSGLVGHWPLNEDSAGKAYDLSGNDYDSTSVTGTSTAVGLGGAKARSFDGSDDKIITGFSLDSSFSVSYFIYVPREGDDYEGVMASNNSKTSSSWQHSWWNGELIYSSQPGSFGALSSGDWHHIVSTFNEGDNTLKCYRNAVETSSDTSNDELNIENLILGTNRASDNYHKGRISDVRVYNRELSKSEIETLARNGGLDV